MSQTGFFVRTQGTNERNYPSDIAIKPNNNLLFLNYSTHSATYPTNEIYELNPEGEIISIKTFTDSSKYYVRYNNLFIIEDTLYILGWGQKKDTLNTPLLLFKSFDLQMNIIKDIAIEVDLPNYQGFIVGNVKYIDNHFRYMASAGDIGSTLAPFLGIISRKGELISLHHNYGSGDLFNLPYDFTKKTDNSGYQLYSWWLNTELNSMDGYILNYDNEMNLESSLQMPNQFTWYFTHLAFSDSVYFLAGMYMKPGIISPWHSGILKMTIEGTLINEYMIETIPDTSSNPAYHRSIDFLPDGNLIFCFTDNIDWQQTPQDYPSKINLLKLTPNLELIWHRYIGKENAKNDAFDMVCAPDGSIIIFAAHSEVPPINYYYTEPLFIKTNSEGLITEINDKLPGVKSSEALLYPNPASDMVAIEFSMAYAAASLEIRNISGQKVFSTQLNANRQRVDISGIAPGTYVYRIFNKQGLDESGKLLVE